MHRKSCIELKFNCILANNSNIIANGTSNTIPTQVVLILFSKYFTFHDFDSKKKWC